MHIYFLYIMCAYLERGRFLMLLRELSSTYHVIKLVRFELMTKTNLNMSFLCCSVIFSPHIRVINFVSLRAQ